MGSWYTAVRQPHHAPLSSLVALFVCWKLLLSAIAFFSPGLGYDTSTQILFESRGLPLLDTYTTTAGERFAQKLVRWDAIYYTMIASRGYTFEQEWAFGWGFTRLVAFLADCESLPMTITLPACACMRYLSSPFKSQLSLSFWISCGCSPLVCHVLTANNVFALPVILL
jgi:hypothetical protein